MTIRVVKPGLSTTVQGGPRYGYAHLGISPCGAADPISLRIANVLVGNNEYAATLEMTLLGPTLEFEDDAVIALCGANSECTLGQQHLLANARVCVPAGSVLQCGGTVDGARSYLAIHGGLDIPPVMQSTSTDVRGNFGGFEGRRLQARDVLRVGNSGGTPPRLLRAGALASLRGEGPIRVTRGAQSDWFGPDEYAKFLATPYTVSEQSDRAGLRLKGEAIAPRQQRQLLTDGIPLGAIQVPQDGQPIILFVDQQTTGGYPKIANVITADMHCIGQIRPRDEVRFAEITIAEAIDALRAQELWLQEIWQE